MLLTRQLQDSPVGGRELLCRLNHDALKEIYGNSLALLELPSSRPRDVKSVIKAFKGHIDGLNESIISEALKAIESGNIVKVFIDGSNLGAFAQAAKQKFPDVEIITFFHNVEFKFFLGSLKQTKSPRALAVLIVNYLAERKAVNYSDKIICLSDRDSRFLDRIYGRGSTHVSPIALRDNLPNGQFSWKHDNREKYALFVGGLFYANRSGISWFIRHVVPHINIKVCIVGKGFENMRHQLERDGKVEVVGAVDNLAEWYLGSQFVIAPIFDGSGMKTKVAEALMYGKKIIGTPEAFSGYEDVAERVGWICTTATDFVAAIGQAKDGIENPFDLEMRAFYVEKYSYLAGRSRLAEILGLEE